MEECLLFTPDVCCTVLTGDNPSRWASEALFSEANPISIKVFSDWHEVEKSSWTSWKVSIRNSWKGGVCSHRSRMKVISQELESIQ
jgi:hypothetical protein